MLSPHLAAHKMLDFAKIGGCCCCICVVAGSLSLSARCLTPCLPQRLCLSPTQRSVEWAVAPQCCIVVSVGLGYVWSPLRHCGSKVSQWKREGVRESVRICLSYCMSETELPNINSYIQYNYNKDSAHAYYWTRASSVTLM